MRRGADAGSQSTAEPANPFDPYARPRVPAERDPFSAARACGVCVGVRLACESIADESLASHTRTNIVHVPLLIGVQFGAV